MSRSLLPFWLGLLLLALGLNAALAGGAITPRQGRHGEMGRLVFPFSTPVSFRAEQQGATLTILFTPEQPIDAVASHIPGVERIEGGTGLARLQLQDGATVKIYPLGTRVVVDTYPHRAGAPASATSPPGAASSVPALSPQLPKPAPAEAPPAPIAAAPASGLVQGPRQAVIGFNSQPGAAAFRRGDRGILVFDTSEVPDLTALQSTPDFANTTVASLPNAQVVSIPLAADQDLSVSPVAGGWQVMEIPAQAPLVTPAPSAAAVVEFPMRSANQSLIISDRLTGGDLLVGTVTQAADAANFREAGPGFTVLPAWLGVVVLPQADDLGLNASLKGFDLVSAAPNGLPLSTISISRVTPAGSDPGLVLPRGATPALFQRMIADMRGAAVQPPLGRLDAQITLAEDMVALGLGPEALAVLNTAVLENPAARDNGQVAALRAVADVLAFRSQPGDFTAPGIIPGPELAFWRAAGLLTQGQAPKAVSGLAAGLPRFETYPDALRRVLDGPIAEALVDNGELAAARQLSASDPADTSMDLARAKILEAEGQAGAALVAFQRLAKSTDVRVAAIARAHVVELQLAAGQLSPARAADALDAELFDWRGPEYERQLRLRIAELRKAGGQWPQAFAMMQSARGLFPEHQPDIDRLRAAMFVNMLGSSSFEEMPPFQALALLQQNEDLIPDGAAGVPVISLLAQRLQALDLPGAAAPMLGRLIRSVPPGATQAELGAALARVDLDAGSPVAALADLSQTEVDDLPSPLAAQRALLKAEAEAAGGNAIAALTIPPPGQVAASGSDPADTTAQIAEQSGQWPQAEQALNMLVSQSVPAAGALTPAQENLLLRLATAASHNNDSATLLALGSRYGSRVGSDPAGQMFQALTAPPLTGAQGLTQALDEISKLQALPSMLNAAAVATPANGAKPLPAP